MAGVPGPGAGALTLPGAAGRTGEALLKGSLLWVLQHFLGSGTVPVVHARRPSWQ